MVTYLIEELGEICVVKVKAFEEIDKDIAVRMVTEARTIAYRLNFNILYDFRKSLSKLSIIDFYQLPRETPVLIDDLAKKVKVAYLILKDKYDDNVKFVENNMINLGFYNCKFIFDEDEAIEWLKK